DIDTQTLTYWLSNTLHLLGLLQNYGVTLPDKDTLLLSSLANEIYTSLLKSIQSQLSPIVVAAFLDSQTGALVAGVGGVVDGGGEVGTTREQGQGQQGRGEGHRGGFGSYIRRLTRGEKDREKEKEKEREKERERERVSVSSASGSPTHVSPTSPTPPKKYTLDSVLSVLTTTLTTLNSHGIPHDVTVQVFRQVYTYIDGVLFNAILLRKDPCDLAVLRGVERGVKGLEGFVKENGVSDDGAWFGRCLGVVGMVAGIDW
ncbi:hypothetical protein HDV00_002015, partial [Rhizophlyctis rosea]